MELPGIFVLSALSAAYLGRWGYRRAQAAGELRRIRETPALKSVKEQEPWRFSGLQPGSPLELKQFEERSALVLQAIPTPFASALLVFGVIALVVFPITLLMDVLENAGGAGLTFEDFLGWQAGVLCFAAFLGTVGWVVSAVTDQLVAVEASATSLRLYTQRVAGLCSLREVPLRHLGDLSGAKQSAGGRQHGQAEPHYYLVVGRTRFVVATEAQGRTLEALLLRWRERLDSELGAPGVSRGPRRALACGLCFLLFVAAVFLFGLEVTGRFASVSELVDRIAVSNGHAPDELRRRGDAAVPALRDLLDDGPRRRWVVRALLLIDSEEARAAVLPLLEHPDALARETTARELNRAGPWAAEPLRALQDDPDPQVREAAEAALRAVESAQ